VACPRCVGYRFGRWARIKEAAAGGTRLRGDDELERFGTAFVCLCVGVPIAGVGGVSGRKNDEEEGIQKAQEALKAIGGFVPTLSAALVAELEPLVSSQAHGQEYAERVHKVCRSDEQHPVQCADEPTRAHTLRAHEAHERGCGATPLATRTPPHHTAAAARRHCIAIASPGSPRRRHTPCASAVPAMRSWGPRSSTG
jgi:hypothetical protein